MKADIILIAMWISSLAIQFITGHSLSVAASILMSSLVAARVGILIVVESGWEIFR